MKSSTSHLQKKYNSGFTLTELLISIAIMVMILGVILVNYRQFDSNIVLTNIAYDIGLSIRKAQTYGISVKGVPGTSGGLQTFDNTYGVHFDATTPQQYFIFIDSASDGYDVGDQTIETFKISDAYTITSICTVEGVTTLCSDSTGRQKFDLTFKRPNPDAKIYWGTSAANSHTEIVGYLQIKLQARADTTLTKTITVRPTGQISISRN